MCFRTGSCDWQVTCWRRLCVNVDSLRWQNEVRYWLHFLQAEKTVLIFLLPHFKDWSHSCRCLNLHVRFNESAPCWQRLKFKNFPPSSSGNRPICPGPTGVELKLRRRRRRTSSNHQMCVQTLFMFRGSAGSGYHGNTRGLSPNDRKTIRKPLCVMKPCFVLQEVVRALTTETIPLTSCLKTVNHQINHNKQRIDQYSVNIAAGHRSTWRRNILIDESVSSV